MPPFINDTDLITSILLSTLILSFLIQSVFYLLIYARARKISPPIQHLSDSFPPLSVIICARNEASSLKKNLPFFLEQDYPEFEVIVVNDCSEDNTDEVLREFASTYKHLKICTISKDKKFTHGKKLALTIGIKSALYEVLLMSDADCVPAGKNWIRYMARHYQSKTTQIVLGVGLYEKKKGLLNLFIRYDTAFIAMQYISMLRTGFPYMGVGRNLSYKKKLFFENRGFASHLKLESGDDDLFISEVSSKTNTDIENNPESFTFSEPETKFSEWLKQKKRHLTTGKFYQQKVKWILGTEYLSRMLLFLSFLLLLFKHGFALPALVVYILHLVIKSFINIIVFRGFNEKFLFLPAILLELIMPVIYSYLHFINHIERKRSRWP